MALALMIVGSIPTIIGTGEAISAQKKQEEAAKHTAKFNLLGSFAAQNEDGDWIAAESFVVLKDGKVSEPISFQNSRNKLMVNKQLYLDHPAHPVQGHKFCGYYFNYPGRENCQGLVSTIQDDPPMLNWIFVDKDTMELRHGSRTDTLGHIVGHWDWTEDEENLILEDDEGFVAVEEEDGSWMVYFDEAGDGSGLPGGRKKMEVCLRGQLLCGISSQFIRKDA